MESFELKLFWGKSPVLPKLSWLLKMSQELYVKPPGIVYKSLVRPLLANNLLCFAFSQTVACFKPKTGFWGWNRDGTSNSMASFLPSLCFSSVYGEAQTLGTYEYEKYLDSNLHIKFYATKQHLPTNPILWLLLPRPILGHSARAVNSEGKVFEYNSQTSPIVFIGDIPNADLSVFDFV